MSGRNRQTAPWLVFLAAISVLMGCATQKDGQVRRERPACPMSHTLHCDRSGHGARAAYSQCQCVRHRDMEAMLRRHE